MKRVALLLAAFAACVSVALPAGAGGLLLYQIEETAAGSRSQGWHGTLYDETGAAVELAPGEARRTAAGIFVGVACTMPWRPCGAIPQEMLKGPNHDLAENVIMDESWSYRVFVTAPGSKSEGTRGMLYRDGTAVVAGERKISTPMGVFVWAENENLWGAHGWYPESK